MYTVVDVGQGCCGSPLLDAPVLERVVQELEVPYDSQQPPGGPHWNITDDDDSHPPLLTTIHHLHYGSTY